MKSNQFGVKPLNLKSEKLMQQLSVIDYCKWEQDLLHTIEYHSHKTQRISHETISESMPLDEQFQVVAIIDKMPHNQKDFKNLLKHKTKRDYVLIVSNNSTKNKFSRAVLKPTGNNFKNQNCNKNKVKKSSCNKNWNPQKAQYAKSPAKNDTGNLFISFKCGKVGHMAHKCRNM
ncbi:hypothetical protein Lal_00018371 [Lupinus albus]|nr:hypothetical protein Lal_00018371 [Lupinus albus]